jgi:enoyl-CoA hydratase
MTVLSRKVGPVVEVTYEVVDHVAIVGLKAPQRKNALTIAMAEELAEAIERIRDDRTVGAAVIYGHGGDFCAGADRALLRDLSQDPASTEGYRGFEVLYNSFHAFGALPVPTIAAATGAVVGGGVNLMLAADLRLVGASVRVDAAFLRIGIHPGGGFFTLAQRAVTDQTSAAMALFGEVLSADDCVRHGLAWRALADDELLSEAHSMAAGAARDPELAREVGRTLRAERAAPLTWAAALQVERPGQMWSVRRAFGSPVDDVATD